MLTHKLQMAAPMSRFSPEALSESSDNNYSTDDSIDDPNYQPDHDSDFGDTSGPSDREMVSKIVIRSLTTHV